MKKNGKIVYSAIYACEVYHARLEKVNRKFSYRTFLFYIDLDEIQSIENKIWLISHNRFNYFNFRDQDHLQFDESKVQSTRSQVEQFLQQNQLRIFPKRIGLLTNLCTLGYQFNPVSFYYCFDENDQAFACIAEVNNTFGEMKLFLLTRDHLDENIFSTRKIKKFYVSPFIDHDVEFDFKLEIPNNNLYNKIDDFRGTKRICTACLTGKKRALTNWMVLKYMLIFPFITLQVIFLIHYQALKLLLLGIPYFKKEEHLDLQTNRMKKYENKHTRKNRKQGYGKDYNTSAQNQF
jgi:DUF1365 family protein